MSVQVATCTVDQLISQHLIDYEAKDGTAIVCSEGQPITGMLSIPEYQRPYCWQRQQLKSLLEDIKSHRLLSSEQPYYLGSLILHQEMLSNGISRLNIIDGQQRVTTLSLIAFLLNPSLGASNSLSFDNLASQQQIKHNLKWLQEHLDELKDCIALDKLQFTLVVTQSEDDAYRFFETQNTGGVRLGGPDIIKAHHLRAVDKTFQTMFAQKWEGLGELDATISALLKGRFWQQMNARELPSYQQTKLVKDTIVKELAQDTGTSKEDISYGRIRRVQGLSGEISQQISQQGYDVRQPLNAGTNSIHYLSYFQELSHRYWENPDLPHLASYQGFVTWLKNLDGCGYLEGLYQACLLLYISQFGEDQLEVAAKKLFRVVYSRRVSNQKAVRENSISAFVKETPVLDWIALSYTPDQCCKRLDRFELRVDPSNINGNSVKKRFMDKVNNEFGLSLNDEQYEKEFAVALTRKVTGSSL
ncbi:DUF262 domain-containing protein [Marinomonas piezotolerans]|uniref:DUF262 domain-containing protein n=1 Tax=Marinomonas piezotolerans TaxID=2213058 RepID=A0A370UCS9_9GAMM|nr:DUF262 domain-containing protein [Marinomonas piezotolerans]RDL45495.1 DUF262 domain-containing protein [Marinomonas piezotolerans]